MTESDSSNEWSSPHYLIAMHLLTHEILTLHRCLNGKRGLAGGYGWRFGDQLISIPSRQRACSPHMTNTSGTVIQQQQSQSHQQISKKRRSILDPKEAAIPCDDHELLDDDNEVEEQFPLKLDGFIATGASSSSSSSVTPLSPVPSSLNSPTSSFQEKRLIEQVDMKTNRVVRRYASTAEATAAMQIPNKISDVLAGRRFSTYGYYWRYATLLCCSAAL